LSAKKGRIHFAEPLPGNDRGDIHTDTQADRRVFKHAAEMGSGAMIFIPGFIKLTEAFQSS
jgi:hypothetical protein